MSSTAFDGGIESWAGPSQRDRVPTIHQRRWMSSPIQKRLSDCHSLGELIQTAHRLRIQRTPDLTAFWMEVPKFLQRRNPQQVLLLDENPNAADQLETIMTYTIDEIESFSKINVSQTTLALAKIIHSASEKGPAKGTAHQIFRHLLIGKIALKKERTLFHIAAQHVLAAGKFDAQSLSDFIYAFGIAGDVLKLEDEKMTYGVLDILAYEVVTRFEILAPPQVFNILWAFANVKSPNSAFFEELADRVIELDQIKTYTYSARDISNMVWAYATRKAKHPRLFTEIADHMVKLYNVRTFTPRELSNVVWAFATVGESNAKLFEKVGDHVVGHANLNELLPQALSDIVWAYATVGESHKELFEKVADHIAMMDNLNEFSPQALSNLVWAYATAGESHPLLFKKVAEHIIGLDNLDSFDPQHLSNIPWAYATAGVSHPMLFEKVGDHIGMLHKLEKYSLHALSNLVWAYATANEAHPKLFKKLANRAIKKHQEFASQDIANFLWAYAAAGQNDRKGLFKTLAPSVEAIIEECSTENLAKIAWAYSVVKVDSPNISNHILNYVEKQNEFTSEELRQIHQWHLWREELNSDIRLPPSLRDKCGNAFT